MVAISPKGLRLPYPWELDFRQTFPITQISMETGSTLLQVDGLTINVDLTRITTGSSSRSQLTQQLTMTTGMRRLPAPATP